MNTASRRVYKPRPKPVRIIRLVEPPSVAGRFAVNIRVGKLTCAYTCVEIPADGGRGFEVAKIDDEGLTVATYHVLLAEDGCHACDCKGMLRHGTQADGRSCKHVDGIAALVKAGKLPAHACPSCNVPAPVGQLCDPCDRQEPAFAAAHGQPVRELKYGSLRHDDDFGEVFQPEEPEPWEYPDEDNNVLPWPAQEDDLPPAA